MTSPRPRPGVLDLPSYKQGESTLGEARSVLKLSANEAPLGPSPKAMAALLGALDRVHVYPDGAARALREAIAAVHELAPERLMVGAGSDELIQLLCRAYLGPGDAILYPRHGFLMYPIYARQAGAEVLTAPETADLRADVDALLEAMTPAVRMVFLANPNNPTGTMIPWSEVQRLREGLPGDVLLVLDGAYAEVVDAPAYDPGVTMVRERDDTVMLRTFSKGYGLAALRLGWAYAPAAVLDAMGRMRSPFSVTTLSLEAGVAAVQDQDHVRRTRDHVTAERARMTQALRGMGLWTSESVANFVLVRFPEHPGKDAAEADASLRANGIIVRRMDAYGLPDCLRITIGTSAQVGTVIDALDRFVRGVAA